MAIVSLAAIRTAPPARIAARMSARAAENERRATEERERRERLASEERAFWLADLATWPEPFRRRLRPLIEERTEPDNFDNSYSGAALFRDRRAGKGGYSSSATFGLAVRTSCMGCVPDLRRAIHAWRRIPPNQRKRRAAARERVESRKPCLLLTLWIWGRRRIMHADVEGNAREYLESRRHDDLWTLEDGPKRIEELQARLAAGDPYVRGPKKGQRRPEPELQRIHRWIAEVRQSMAAARAALAEIEAEPDVLRWIGFYKSRRRHLGREVGERFLLGLEVLARGLVELHGTPGALMEGSPSGT